MISVLKADITTLAVDAIVNAANSALSGGGGVDGAIHRAAGPDLLTACRALGRCPVGEAVVTSAFRLSARVVIHAVGPVWDGGASNEELLLQQVYERAFARAREHHVRSIAFPAISAGAYRFPIDRAAEIALRTMLAQNDHFDRIVACVFDDKTLAEYESILRRLQAVAHGDVRAPRTQFVEFLRRLSNRTATRGEWEMFAVNHYTQADLEQARVEIVRASLAAGDWSWPEPPKRLRQRARELHEQLRTAGR